MKIPNIIIKADFDYDAFYKRAQLSMIKFRYTIDIFGTKTFSFNGRTAYKKFKQEYEDHVSHIKFMKELESGKHNKQLGYDWNEEIAKAKKKREDETIRNNKR